MELNILRWFYWTPKAFKHSAAVFQLIKRTQISNFPNAQWKFNFQLVVHEHYNKRTSPIGSSEFSLYNAISMK